MASSSQYLIQSSSQGKSGRNGSSVKPKPADVAAEARRVYIPAIKKLGTYNLYSQLYQQPLVDLVFPSVGNLEPPTFHVKVGDPVDLALQWADQVCLKIPFICAAHERKAGGEWQTAGGGYEEKLCRRSNLSSVLETPTPGQHCSNYPIPLEGGILSDMVVVYRGPHPMYEVLDIYRDLPIVSVHPLPRPKVTSNGTKYSFDAERQIVLNKLKAALRIVLYHGYTSVVIGDFGLGSYKNPPREMAELWREAFLYDPAIRGKFRHAAFVFDDPVQSTSKIIAEDIAKKSGSSSKGKGKSKKEKGHGHGLGSSLPSEYPTDLDIFTAVFAESEIRQVLNTPDPRLGLGMITS